MIHATLTKFGYPRTLLREGEHWALLARPAQITLGSLVLCSTSEARAYGELPAAAFAEQREMVSVAERMLQSLVDYQRINYLMLMMVDPHVHFHIIPRYEGLREHQGVLVPDLGWPGLPDLARTVPLGKPLLQALRELAGD